MMPISSDVSSSLVGYIECESEFNVNDLGGNEWEIIDVTPVGKNQILELNENGE